MAKFFQGKNKTPVGLHFWLTALVIFGLGTGVGAIARREWVVVRSPWLPPIIGHQIREGRVGLTNPLLGCEVSDRKQFAEYKTLEDKVGAFINNEKKKGTITSASFYFRESDSGRWTGINENETFYPASLLKVPLMITYLKLAENDPEFLRKRVRYESGPDQNAREQIPSGASIQPGATYTIDELLSFMIVDSDNNAATLLFKSISESELEDVLGDLGINIPLHDFTGDFMSPRTYSLFFRILYNASYLNKEMSQKALELLSRSNFNEGLRAGVDAKVTVAHKFGEAQKPDEGIVELHDCGIVYATDPYFICVMTKGKDISLLKKSVAQLSALVYNEVTLAKP